MDALLFLLAFVIVVLALRKRKPADDGYWESKKDEFDDQI